MRALSKDEIADAMEDEIMSTETPKHPSGGVIKVENNYLENGHNSPSDPRFRWNGPNTSVRPAALTPAQLDELRANAPKKQKTFAERMAEAAKTGEVVKPSEVIVGKSGVQKVR